MRRSVSRPGSVSSFVVAASVLLVAAGVPAVTGCDDKKQAEETKPALSAALPPAPSVVPGTKEPEPVEEEKKKPPRECPTGKLADFGGNAPLEAEIRRKLQKPTGDITITELAKVKSVNLSQVRIDELDPCIFPHLTGAKEVFLGAGKLDDLSPLKNLKNLESLRASLNRVADVNPLSGLTKLDRLDLGNTQVTDVKPLATLVNLTELDLGSTPLTDVSPLASCVKLERLTLKKSSVKSVAALKPLKSLKVLDITDTTVDDKLALMPLVGPKGLKIVD